MVSKRKQCWILESSYFTPKAAVQGYQDLFQDIVLGGPLMLKIEYRLLSFESLLLPFMYRNTSFLYHTVQHNFCPV